MKYKNAVITIFENIRNVEKSIEATKEVIKRSDNITEKQKFKFEQICLILDTIKDKSLSLMEEVDNGNEEKIIEFTNTVFSLSILIRDETKELLTELVVGFSTPIDEIIH